MASNLNSELSSIADDLTALLKSEIRRKGLIGTGRMYNSVQYISKKRNELEFTFELVAVDYFDVVDSVNNILRDMYSTAAYKSIEDRIGKLPLIIINEKLKKI